jgi:hypothetical protein
LIEEFKDCGSEQGNENCANLLNNIEADEDESWWYWVVLMTIFAELRLLGLGILQHEATKSF